MGRCGDLGRKGRKTKQELIEMNSYIFSLLAVASVKQKSGSRTWGLGSRDQI